MGSPETSYAYDGLDRLTSAENTGSSPYSRSFTYSPIGNLLSATEDDLTVNYRYGVGAGPHAVTSLDGCTGDSPPESGTWTVSSQTSCGKSAVGVDDVVIQGGNTLTLSGSSLNVQNVLHVDGTLPPARTRCRTYLLRLPRMGCQWIPPHVFHATAAVV